MKTVFEITGPAALWNVYHKNKPFFRDIALLPCSYFQACGMVMSDGGVYIPRAHTCQKEMEEQILIIEKITGNKNQWCSIGNINKDSNKEVEDVFLVHHSQRSWDEENKN